MRHSRQLSTTEQWDLALLLAFFTVSMLVLAAVWHTRAIPRLWAFAFQTEPAASPPPAMAPASATPAAQLPPAQPSLPQAPALAPEPYTVVEPEPAMPAPAKPAPRKPAVAKAREDVRYYNGAKYRYVKTLRMRVTAYAPDARCCWPYNGTTTASGKSVRTNGGRLVAADTRIVPFHSLVSIPGYHSGQPVPVLDRGGAIKGNRIDVLMPTFAAAQNWGARDIPVKIYAPVD